MISSNRITKYVLKNMIKYFRALKFAEEADTESKQNEEKDSRATVHPC